MQRSAKTNAENADAYERHQQKCNEIRAENSVLLKEFAAWMRHQDLAEDTVGMHLRNTAFYVQTYLLYEQPLRPQEGCFGLDMYLGSWFIRKGPIATPGTVKTNGTSLIKFYSFLVEKGMVTQQQIDAMRKAIKTDMKHWQERARRYNDPEMTDPRKIWI